MIQFVETKKVNKGSGGQVPRPTKYDMTKDPDVFSYGSLLSIF